MEDQLYVFPEISVEPNNTEAPLQIVDGTATAAFGKGFHNIFKASSSIIGLLFKSNPDTVLYLILYIEFSEIDIDEIR